MKFSVLLFFAGLFGALGTVFILLSFGTDYWLLAWETSKTDSQLPDTVEHGNLTFYHEGFFWRCSFEGEGDEDILLKFWFTNQPFTKKCVQAYLSPFPVSEQTHNATTYESAIIYRGFWSVFMLLSVTAVILGGFILVCAAPFTSPCLYKAGGGLYLTAGFFILLATVLTVIWLEVMDVVDLYVEYQKSYLCPDFQLNITYGLSFMFAPVGVFFCFLSGLLFLLIGQALKKHYQ
ncbi:transmembrane protein 182 [Ictalurus punctatus]|uniref:Transmembrane protein 182 n=1 Tax=Ictalurus punctatus TaxID=7998 RepID=A0A2D0R4U5_ICTPU|nr:transmembrane protein 182 [Ictalurus punctatus]